MTILGACVLRQKYVRSCRVTLCSLSVNKRLENNLDLIGVIFVRGVANSHCTDKLVVVIHIVFSLAQLTIVMAQSHFETVIPETVC